MAVLAVELKDGILEVVALLELLVGRVVLAHNHHLVRALVVVAEPLQLLLLLEVVALVVLVAVAVAGVELLSTQTTLALAALAAMA